MSEDTLQSILARNATLVWSEPWPGACENGHRRDGHVELRAAARDCCDIQRHRDTKSGRALRSNRECLADFIAVNWATEGKE